MSLIEWLDRAEADLGRHLYDSDITMIGQFYEAGKTYEDLLELLREADRVPQLADDEVPVNLYEPRGAEGVAAIPLPSPEAEAQDA